MNDAFSTMVAWGFYAECASDALQVSAAPDDGLHSHSAKKRALSPQLLVRSARVKERFE